MFYVAAASRKKKTTWNIWLLCIHWCSSQWYNGVNICIKSLMVHYSEIVTWMPFILLFKVWPKYKEINATPQTFQVSVTFNLHPLDTESANWTLQPHYPTAVAVKGFHLLQGYCIWLHHTVNCSYYFVYTQHVIKTFHFCKWSVQLTPCVQMRRHFGFVCISV